MKFDVPGRKGPMKVVMYEDYREHVFPLPYATDDPVEIAMLYRHPTVRVVAEVEPTEEPKARPRKEV